TAYAFAWVNGSGRPGDTSRFDASGAPTDIGQKAFVLAVLAAAGSASAPVPNTKVTEAPHVTTPSVAAAARALFEQYRAKLSGWGRVPGARPRGRRRRRRRPAGTDASRRPHRVDAPERE